MEWINLKRITKRNGGFSLRLFASFIWMLAGGRVHAEDFTVTYTFANKAEVAIDSPAQAVTAKIHRPGGAGLQSQTFTPAGWTAELLPSPDEAFCDAAIRIDLTPVADTMLNVSEIEVYQQSSGPHPVKVRICCTLNGSRPDPDDRAKSSPEETLQAASVRFSPSLEPIAANGKTPLSIYACASAPPDGGTWILSRIIIRGTCQPSDLPENMVVVSNEQRQQMRFGIDAERLWWWYPGIGKELARYAVGDLQADYVRVAIFAAYEREEGRKNPKAYERILDMMKALKRENPAIKFFASPRPLEEAYSQEEWNRDWDGKVPWSPYPIWILPFERTGTDEEGKPIWQMGNLDEKKFTRYMADYLNFMHQEGFSIEYLDVTNELEIPSGKVKYMVEHLKELLDPGIKMPLIVAPSSWNMQQGLAWLKSANSDMLDIVACHNTDPGGSMESFAELGRTMGKEIWNSELHDWVGVEPHEEIMNSETLWKHIRAGFSGIDSWLFFGPIEGKDHTMIWTDGSSIRTSYKYEIFKQLVNNANRGYYLDTPMPRKDLYTAAFMKDKVVTVWAFNSSSVPMPDLGFSLQGIPLNGQKVEVTRWHASTSNTGKASKISSSRTFFSHTIEGESIYCFKIVLP